MEQSLSIQILVLVLVLATILTLVLVRVRRAGQPAETDTTEPRRSAPRLFTGERVYSLALRGKYRLFMRVAMISTGVMPLLVLPVLYAAAQHNPDGLFAGRFWIFSLALVGWSGLTVLFLRALVQHRRRTTVTLTSEGVHYFAPSAGIFPARKLFIPWGAIDKVGPADPRNKTLLQVESAAGNFMFNCDQAREVVSSGIDGEFFLQDYGNDLYQDLLLYSGVPAPQVRQRTAV